MFGYVTVNRDELKIRDFRRYHSFYCGLCHTLKKRYGVRGQMTLTYDMTFAAMLLNALYEKPLTEEKHFCRLHPTHRQEMVFNEITEYTADMSIILAYYNLMDDIRDDGSAAARAGAKALRKPVQKAEALYPDKAVAIQKYLYQLIQEEQRGSTDLDLMAGFSGSIIGEILLYREDEWSDVVRNVGFYLGKYVYLLDAFDDLEEDLKKQRYNPWISYADRKDFDALVENTLTMMISECASEFEKLPIIQDVDILRNILYSGVWNGFERARARKEKDAKGGKTKR